MTAEHIYYISPRTTLKAYGDGRIGGYLVAFGLPRDAHNEYFRDDAEYGLNWYDRRPVLFHHGLGEAGAIPIGVITSIRKDHFGLYAEAILDINHEDPTIRQWARTAYNLVQQGKLGWSSGSAPNLVDVGADGDIRQWVIVEGSLTPTPAEPKRTRVEMMKAAIKAVLDEQSQNPELFIPGALEGKEPAAKDPVKRAVSSTQPLHRGTHMSKANQPQRTPVKMDMAMLLAALGNVNGLSSDQKLAILDALGQQEAGEMPEPELAMDMTEEDAPIAMDGTAPQEDPMRGKGASEVINPQDVARQIAHYFNQAQKNAPAPRQPLPAASTQNPMQPSRPSDIQVFSKYHDLTAEDMAFFASARAAFGKHQPFGYEFDREFWVEMMDKGQKSYKSGNLKMEPDEARKFLAVKANELDNTGAANAAGNWVPTLWNADLWRRVRVENNIASSFQVVEMPSNPYELPFESTDPTVYFVPETTNREQLALDNTSNPTPDSLVSAGKTTLTAKKLAVRMGFSTEITEDSIIPFIPQARDQAMRAIENAIDNVVGNGDTETGGSANINDIDGTPAGTAKYLIFNGLRKLALVTNPSLAINMNAQTPTLQKIREARFSMLDSLNVYANRPQDMVIFCDVPTYGKLLNVDELLVYMNNGRGSTVNDGSVPAIDGIPVYASQELSLTNAAGKVSETGSNNTRGQLILAAKPGWKIGYRRQVTLYVEFLPYYDSYQLYASVRIALTNKDNVCASVLYNIAV